MLGAGGDTFLAEINFCGCSRRMRGVHARIIVANHTASQFCFKPEKNADQDGKRKSTDARKQARVHSHTRTHEHIKPHPRANTRTFGNVCQRQFSLILGPGKQCIFNYNVHSFSSQLCNIFIDILLLNCFGSRPSLLLLLHLFPLLCGVDVSCETLPSRRVLRLLP